MSKGTYWVYRGLVRWTHDINKIGEATITWRAEVRQTIQHDNIRAAVINGFPSDLNWADDRTKPADTLLIQSNGKFYVVSGQRFMDELRALEVQGTSVHLHDDDLFLEWPLKTGDKFSCDAAGMARPDTLYCWFVESSSPARLAGVVGVSTGHQNAFSLIYRTNPDHIRFAFVPQIGITRYEYHHHGTVADSDLKLVEFGQPD